MLQEPEFRAVLDKKEWTAAQAQRVLRAQHNSGLTVKEFTRRAGLATWKLYAWRGRLHKTPGPTQGAGAAPSLTPQPAAFVPLEGLPARGASAELESACAELVHPGGLRVRLTAQAPASWLPLFCARRWGPRADAASGREAVRGARSGRCAQGLRWAESVRPDSACEGPAERTSVHFFQSPERPGQPPVLGSQRVRAVPKAPGARPLPPVACVVPAGRLRPGRGRGARASAGRNRACGSAAPSALDSRNPLYADSVEIDTDSCTKGVARRRVDSVKEFHGAPFAADSFAQETDGWGGAACALSAARCGGRSGAAGGSAAGIEALADRVQRLELQVARLQKRSTEGGARGCPARSYSSRCSRRRLRCRSRSPSRCRPRVRPSRRPPAKRRGTFRRTFGGSSRSANRARSRSAAPTAERTRP